MPVYWLKLLDAKCYNYSIRYFIRRWVECVDVDGDYLENKHNYISSTNCVSFISIVFKLIIYSHVLLTSRIAVTH